ncbi:MAG: zinc ribbon domain-containing protein [Candidatus Hydrothermarchaeales archaeon]
MFCRNCGNEVDEDWKFCPHCGIDLHEKRALSRTGFLEFPNIEGLFDDVVKGIEEMSSLFGRREFRRDFEKERHMFKDFFDLPQGIGGISVRISSTDDKEPKFDIKTFGNLSGHENEIKEWFGIPVEGGEEIEEPKIIRKPPKVTEEPETKMRRIGGKLEVKVKVPGVKSEDDIDVRKLEESIEIRAYAGDKAYFTLFSVPPRARILSKKLENEELTLEVEG